MEGSSPGAARRRRLGGERGGAFLPTDWPSIFFLTNCFVCLKTLVLFWCTSFAVDRKQTRKRSGKPICGCPGYQILTRGTYAAGI